LRLLLLREHHPDVLRHDASGHGWRRRYRSDRRQHDVLRFDLRLLLLLLQGGEVGGKEKEIEEAAAEE